MEHVLLYLEDTDTFSVGDPRFLCGPFSLVIRVVVYRESEHI